MDQIADPTRPSTSPLLAQSCQRDNSRLASTHPSNQLAAALLRHETRMQLSRAPCNLPLGPRSVLPWLRDHAYPMTLPREPDGPLYPALNRLARMNPYESIRIGFPFQEHLIDSVLNAATSLTTYIVYLNMRCHLRSNTIPDGFLVCVRLST